MSEEEVVTVQQLVVEGDDAPLAAPLAVRMNYTLNRPLKGAVWELVYEADMAHKRHAILLNSSEPTDLAPGTHTYHHTVSRISTDNVKEKYLLQVGLLKLALHAADEASITTINMVTNVTKASDGVLMRKIINPVE